MRRRDLKNLVASVMILSVLTGCNQTNINVETQATDSQLTQASLDKTAGYNTDENGEPVIVSDFEFPDYYNEELKATMKTLDATATDTSINYVYITDLHIDDTRGTMESMYRQLESVVALVNSDDLIDFVCLGGDLYNGRCLEQDAAMNYIKGISQILQKCNKPVFILHGNHDDNSFSAQVDDSLFFDPDVIIDKSEWYDCTMSYFSQYVTNYQDGYYYYDIPGKNTRVVCLNMSDYDETLVDGKLTTMGMYFYGYSDAQIKWLVNDAFSKDNCQYIILSHDAFEYPEGYNAGSNRDTLEEICAAAMQNTSFSKGGISKDFTNWNSKILVYNCGHIHMERLIQKEEAGGLPLLNTETAQIQNFKIWLEGGYSKCPAKLIDTITEASYDVVVCEPQEINVIRFGSGEDYSFQVSR